jgi:arsenate reductase
MNAFAKFLPSTAPNEFSLRTGGAHPGFLIYNTAGINFFRRFSAMKFYGYNKCGTCRKAKTFLDEKNMKYTDIDITLTPPPKSVLKQAMKAKGMRKLFNTSGVQYKELKIKDKIGSMTEAEAIDLLADNGRLVKRPIAVEKDRVTVGFNLDEYESVWG